MHVVIVSAVYPPEPVVSARMSQDLALYLTQRSVQVTVLCPQPSRPINADYNDYKKQKIPLIIHESGITVVRLPSYAAPQSHLFPRVRESFSFGQHACRYLRNCRVKPNAIYVNSWPLLSQALLASHARCNKIPLILQIMDVYPESLIAKLSSRFKRYFIRPLIYLDRWIAQQADSIIVISEKMRCTYLNSRGICADKVVSVNIWQDEGLFENLPPRQSACKHYGIPEGKFTFLYLGNIGPVAGADLIINAFHDAALNNAQLLIVGDGSLKAKCVALVERLRMNNVQFINDLSAANVPLLQSMADVCLLPLKKGHGMTSIPSKLAAYMFSAKPIIATVDVACDTAHAIREANCGWVGEAENINWLVSKMREVVVLPVEERTRYGQRGRSFGLKHFSKANGVMRLAGMVLKSAIREG
jgi:glycosyltransferase involved in cell wall biosynthesis